MSEQNKQNHYTAEFRESAVKLAIESDQAVSKTAEERGVNKNTLQTWIGKYHRPQKQNAVRVEEEHLYDELKRLRKENKRLTEERDMPNMVGAIGGDDACGRRRLPRAGQWLLFQDPSPSSQNIHAASR